MANVVTHPLLIADMIEVLQALGLLMLFAFWLLRQLLGEDNGPQQKPPKGKRAEPAAAGRQPPARPGKAAAAPPAAAGAEDEIAQFLRRVRKAQQHDVEVLVGDEDQPEAVPPRRPTSLRRAAATTGAEAATSSSPAAQAAAAPPPDSRIQ